MTDAQHTRTLAQDFINIGWNQGQLAALAQFLHPDFVDYSLPPALPANAEGLRQWVQDTSASFEHHTTIEEQVTEGEKTMLKIRMQLRHVGPWRGIAPAGAEVSTVGYRFLQLQDGKIIGHWALIDGNAIENQLRQTSQGCKIQQ
jgi:predicted ester cyclase